MTEKPKTTCGAKNECYMKQEVKELIEKVKDFQYATAREVVRTIAKFETEGRDLPKPKAINEEAPSEPNVYSDDSLKNPKGDFWSVGGIGIW